VSVGLPLGGTLVALRQCPEFAETRDSASKKRYLRVNQTLLFALPPALA
jgi:hypothetical protein